MNDYAELQVTSNYSLLRGASHPHELIKYSAELNHKAIALTDHNTLSGVVRAHMAAKEYNIKFIPAACINLTLDLESPDEYSGPRFLCFPTNREAYGKLSCLINLGKKRAPKGKCWLTIDDLLCHVNQQIVIALPPENFQNRAFLEMLSFVRNSIKNTSAGCYLAANYLYQGNDSERLEQLEHIAEQCQTPLVATNDIHIHEPARQALHDVLTCIRQKCIIDKAGSYLHPNAERHLKSAKEMINLFSNHKHAVNRSMEISNCCQFNLEEITNSFSFQKISNKNTYQKNLIQLCWKGASLRWKKNIPEPVKLQINHELKVIGKLGYARYFLIVYDIISFARRNSILYQGRGSAANSIVCYCLTITAIDPNRMNLLFERFLSEGRGDPPDIDIDFENERREEVIQYIYEKYGREYSAIIASVIRYRRRSALKEVGKVLGLSDATLSTLTTLKSNWSKYRNRKEQLIDSGLNHKDQRINLTLKISKELIGFPRHLSQHVGGVVISDEPLCEIVPIINSTSKERTNIEWDKDDFATLGIMKIDILGLGILTCIRKTIDLIAYKYNIQLSLDSIPPEDPKVYDMLCRADSIGVFQVESRAQMSMLPRLKPRTLYDLVIEIAIVRPGPIQGNMVHPYLRRRNGEEAITFPSYELKQILKRTLGIPIFQEQAMKMVIVAAGFTPEEADRLRRSMATFHSTGQINIFRKKMINGMIKRGYSKTLSEDCFKQIEGFSKYGFPESHAASFALLVYSSAWLKYYYPAAFAGAILNSQPMGFYGASQIIRDVKNHGVAVCSIDINKSKWESSLEEEKQGIKLYSLRLGFSQIKGFTENIAKDIIIDRGDGYKSISDLYHRTNIPKNYLKILASADAFSSINISRREALWQIEKLEIITLPLLRSYYEIRKSDINYLPPMKLGENIIEDYKSFHLSLRSHPFQLLRKDLCRRGVLCSKELNTIHDKSIVKVAGIVLTRQRPSTSKGVFFITLEDESGSINLICWKNIFKRFQKIVINAEAIICSGYLQRNGIVMHIIAEKLEDYSHALQRLDDLDASIE